MKEENDGKLFDTITGDKLDPCDIALAAYIMSDDYANEAHARHIAFFNKIIGREADHE